jgi:hypothetical protein
MKEKSNILIVSFYTDDWEYPEHAKRMAADCQQLGLECHIERKESTRDYIKNTAIKPFFIRDCLQKFQRSLLWVDIDGILLKDPGLTDIKEDFAACDYINKQNLDRDWSVPILWFNYTPGSLKLVDEWCANATKGTDEAAFDVAWKKLKNQITVYRLPKQYLFSKWRTTLIIPEDTIFCNQLSTFEDKMKRKVNGKLIE